MKPNINDTDYLEKLDRAVNSPSGRILFDFLQNEFEKLSYDNIDTNQSIESIGQNYLAVKTARIILSNTLRFLSRNNS